MHSRPRSEEAGHHDGLPPGVRIRVLTPADSVLAEEIATAGASAWVRRPVPAEVAETVERLRREISTLDANEKGVFVAEKSETLVGLARIARSQEEASTWWLLGLLVHPDHRRRGIAKALVRRCIAYARERGATVIRSETHVDNAPSIGLHGSVGFENRGEFTAGDGDRKVAFRLVASLPGGPSAASA